jgi:hypothetical protein
MAFLYVLSYKVDESNTGYITSLKLNEFLKPFGPLSKSIEKVRITSTF